MGAGFLVAGKQAYSIIRSPKERQTGTCQRNSTRVIAVIQIRLVSQALPRAPLGILGCALLPSSSDTPGPHSAIIVRILGL